ncbi:MAG: iron ABC transporter permease [archaeon]|nr:iron ABC transporter permease [archaeon]
MDEDIVGSAVERWLSDEVSEEDRRTDRDEYRDYVFRKYVFILFCLVLAFLVSGYAMSIGEYHISLFDTYARIWEHIIGNIHEKVDDYVVWNIRFPRVLGGFIAGASLAVCGVAMQSMLKNPLADTYTTGVSSGASLGATLAICAGVSFIGGSYAIVVNAFVFALIPMAAILAVSRLKNSSTTTIIMAGIAVMYLFNACNTVLKLWAESESLSNVYNWSVGSLTGLKWEDVAVMALFSVIGIVLIQLTARRLNMLSMGDEAAKSMGVNADRCRLFCLTVTALVAAAIVCFTGLIGFIGLVCPHVARMFVGSDNRLLIPASAMFGGAFLLLADVIGRIVIAPNTLAVGVVTAFIGGPMFLYLIIRERRSGW